MRYFVWLSLPLLLGGCLGAVGGGQPPVNPSGITQGSPLVLECRKNPDPATGVAAMCRPVSL